MMATCSLHCCEDVHQSPNMVEAWVQFPG